MNTKGPIGHPLGAAHLGRTPWAPPMVGSLATMGSSSSLSPPLDFGSPITMFSHELKPIFT